MTEIITQASFERVLSDLEKLFAITYQFSFGRAEFLDDAIYSKLESLAKYTVYASDSTTMSDIEHLIELRHTQFPTGVTRIINTTACVDAIIRQKFAYLADSDTKQLDMDPFEALQRLSAIKANLHRKQIYVNFKGCFIEAVRQKLDHLAKYMTSVDDKPSNTIGSKGTHSSAEHVTLNQDPDDTANNERTISALEDELRAVKDELTQSRSETLEAVGLENELATISENLADSKDEKIAELKDQVSQLKTHIQKTNDILHRIGDCARTQTLNFNAANTSKADEESSIGGVTPYSEESDEDHGFGLSK